MKIAIPSKNNMVDDHFGHCDHFTIVTIENGAIVKSEKLDPGKTCGCKSNLVNELTAIGVEALLAGNIGQGAINKINNAGIKVVRGCKGEITLVVNDYLAGKIQDQLIVCTPDEHGHECSHN